MKAKERIHTVTRGIGCRSSSEDEQLRARLKSKEQPMFQPEVTGKTFQLSCHFPCTFTPKLYL
jgi:hypothetical protein